MDILMSREKHSLELFKELVAVSDVVLTNMVTGVPEKMGIGFEVLSKDSVERAHQCGAPPTLRQDRHAVAELSFADGGQIDFRAILSGKPRLNLGFRRRP